MSEMVNIHQLERARVALGEKCNQLIKSCQRAGRNLTKEEQRQFDEWCDEGVELGVKIANEKRLQAYEMSRGTPIYGRDTPTDVGRAFVESEAYRSMMERAIWSSDPCIYHRSIIASAIADAGVGMPVAPELVTRIIGTPQQPLRVRDLLPTGTTTSNSVAFVRETSFTNKAAAVKESVEGEEQTKPESDKEFEPEVVYVQTIAHWIPATRQIIADAPALQSFINSQLIYGLKVEEEYELLFGDGTAPHLTGICPLAMPYDSTLPTQLGVTSITRLDDIRAASYQVEQALYSADGVILNPFDWAAIELVKDNIGKYIWVSVTDGGISRAWRLPVVVSHTMPVGHFLVGAFKLGAQLWDREESNIRIAEQHGDFFVKNLVAILAEERLALTVYSPAAFVYGTFEEYGS